MRHLDDPRLPSRGHFLTGIALLLLGGCHSEKPEPSPNKGQAPGKPEAPPKLPKLSLSDTTSDVLFTWVNDAGDFRVVEKIAEIPQASREKVRVVVTRGGLGTGEWVYVADLTQKATDGNYLVSVWSREAWDEVGAQKRKARLEALAPREGDGKAQEASPADKRVIIYGADWCKPCHQAEDYLKSKGVPVIKKDIEADPAANQEMREKLRRSHLPGASIPIIDVRGRLLVGFSPQAIDLALRATDRPSAL